MTKLKVFWLGAREFRLTCTTDPGEELREAYDWGREWAHRLTFRYFEPY